MAKVLLADDSTTMQKVVDLVLKDAGHEVKCANNGQAALEAVTSFRPDVVLAYIKLPGLTGYELSKRIKSTGSMSKIAVALLAGAFEPIDEGKMKDASADSYLIKPFQTEDLLNLINSLLPEGQASAAAANAAAAAAAREEEEMIVFSGEDDVDESFAEPEVMDESEGDPFDMGESDVYDAEPMEADVYEAETMEVDAYEAEPMEADVYEAEPMEADVYEAEPMEADVYEAEPMEADVYEAEAVEEAYEAEPMEADVYEAEAVEEAYEAEPMEADVYEAEAVEEVYEAEPMEAAPAARPALSRADAMAASFDARPKAAPAAQAAPAAAAAMPAMQFPSKDELSTMFMTRAEDLLRETLADIDLKDSLVALLEPHVKEAISQMMVDVLPELTQRVLRELVTESLTTLNRELENIMWETVPDLAESLIRKELDRIKAES